MRKTTGFILALICISMFAVSFRAAEAVDHKIDEAGMELSLPDDWTVFSRESDAKRFVCLNARCGKPEAEITVGVFPLNDVKDFNDCSNDELEGIAEDMQKAPKKHYAGWYRDCFIYMHPQAAFIVTDYKQYSSNTFSRQYYTVIDGHGICVTLYSLEGEVTVELSGILKAVIDSCVFDGLPVIHEFDKAPGIAGADHTGFDS
jgi:hypothetical protein